MSARVALVTGASKGIGQATALALAADGRAVACAYGSDDAAAKETVRLIEEGGGTAAAFQADVADPEAVRAMTAAAAEELGPPVIVVANAGMNKDGLAVRYDLGDWDRMLRVNLTGSFTCIRAVLPHMMKARWGRIVAVSSAIALRGNAGQSAYGASKSGLVGMTRSLAKEYAARGITANVLCPGFVETEMTSGLAERARKALDEEIPAGRVGTVEEIAAAIRFLASEEASYVNGAVLAVDGGLTA
ncbi:MAG TPA: 3-oxoacyl-ACP reductase FabG [Actinomycetota bacterium]|nr:3-oxoacyl-ACP reductase FabG [Actinomycetota bacterium]